VIKNFEFYHGTVFTKLIDHSKEPISFSRFMTLNNASYIINKSIGIYIKHSQKRLTPWSFTLSKIHQEEILRIKIQFKDVYLVLVCGEDGVVALNYTELKEILDVNKIHKTTEWVRVSRSKRKEYTVTGADGILSYKMSKDAFPKVVLAKIKESKLISKKGNKV